MRRTLVAVLSTGLVCACAVMAFQGRRFQREYFPFQDEDEPLTLPSDANEPAEFVFARLRYGNVRYGNSYWMRRGAWSVDFPKADRQFLQGVRRLTRINARSVEHVVDLVSDDIFNYPFVYVVEAGHWDLPDDQARKLREYIDRGGFLMTDDFHGTMEWGIFMQGIEKAFPGVTVTDLENDDPIFHVLYDLDQRFQVPGIVNWPFSQTHEYDGFESRWRALRDAKGRVVMAICHNMDLGDAWEWADHPKYPEKYASLAYRVGINNIIYAMTH